VRREGHGRHHDARPPRLTCSNRVVRKTHARAR
jgi:hypothetical protein